MPQKFYKNVFNYFTFFGILSVKLEGRRYKISNVLLIKTIVIVIVFCVFKLYEHIIKRSLLNRVSASSFAQSFSYFSHWVILLIMCTVTFNIPLCQKNIAEILTILLKLKIFCEEQKFQLSFKKIKIKMFISFALFGSVIAVLTYRYFKFESNVEYLILNVVISVISKLYIHGFYDFLHISVLHWDFIIENFNRICKDQLELLHNDCEKILQNFHKIQKILKISNKAFGKVIFLITTQQVMYNSLNVILYIFFLN